MPLVRTLLARNSPRRDCIRAHDAARRRQTVVAAWGSVVCGLRNVYIYTQWYAIPCVSMCLCGVHDVPKRGATAALGWQPLPHRLLAPRPRPEPAPSTQLLIMLTPETQPATTAKTATSFDPACIEFKYVEGVDGKPNNVYLNKTQGTPDPMLPHELQLGTIDKPLRAPFGYSRSEKYDKPGDNYTKLPLELTEHSDEIAVIRAVEERYIDYVHHERVRMHGPSAEKWSRDVTASKHVSVIVEDSYGIKLNTKVPKDASRCEVMLRDESGGANDFKYVDSEVVMRNSRIVPVVALGSGYSIKGQSFGIRMIVVSMLVDNSRASVPKAAVKRDEDPLMFCELLL